MATTLLRRPARSLPLFASVARRRALARPRPELLGLLLLAAVLNLWGLARNGYANDYYSAAVRSMSASWHAFLFGSFDASGAMTVDKPPLALWVQVASVKVFGFHSLSLLVPQALMGVATVGLVYDLTRRVWGRPAGFVAGLALATTPIAVAISRHNNPDALLILCCVGALWAVVRALEDGRTRWLVLAGVCVGLGFEAKMAAALLVVPGLVAAWLWVAPRGRRAALRDLAVGGAAMLAVAGAWPLLVALTPAADRPWVSGTSDNSILSLILGYNGLGRLSGQAGGPQALAGAAAARSAYYVSELAPFAAALVGGGVGQVLRGGRTARVTAPLAIAGGVLSTLVVLHHNPRQLTWLAPLLVTTGVLAAGAAAALGGRHMRTALAVGLAALFIAPATWAAETLGHATNGTFPAGRPASGGPGGGDSQSIDAALGYARRHGGGTLAVSSQNGGAATAILRSQADVVAIGGFSGRESEVSVAWLAGRVESGAIRWVLATGGNAGPGGDARVGSRSVMAEVAATCTKVSSVSGLYDCAGKAAALRPSPTPVSSRASASAATAIATPPTSSST